MRVPGFAQASLSGRGDRGGSARDGRPAQSRHAAERVRARSRPAARPPPTSRRAPRRATRRPPATGPRAHPPRASGRADPSSASASDHRPRRSRSQAAAAATIDPKPPPSPRSTATWWPCSAAASDPSTSPTWSSRVASSRERAMASGSRLTALRAPDHTDGAASSCRRASTSASIASAWRPARDSATPSATPARAASRSCPDPRAPAQRLTAARGSLIRLAREVQRPAQVRQRAPPELSCGGDSRRPLAARRSHGPRRPRRRGSAPDAVGGAAPPRLRAHPWARSIAALPRMTARTGSPASQAACAAASITITGSPTSPSSRSPASARAWR